MAGSGVGTIAAATSASPWAEDEAAAAVRDAARLPEPAAPVHTTDSGSGALVADFSLAVAHISLAQFQFACCSDDDDMKALGGMSGLDAAAALALVPPEQTATTTARAEPQPARNEWAPPNSPGMTEKEPLDDEHDTYDAAPAHFTKPVADGMLKAAVAAHRFKKPVSSQRTAGQRWRRASVSVVAAVRSGRMVTNMLAPEIWNEFALLDLNNDGVLDLNHLSILMRRLGTKVCVLYIRHIGKHLFRIT